MNIFEIVYSVAGAKSEPALKHFQNIKQSLLTEPEWNCVQEMIKTHKSEGHFPSYEFLCKKYGDFNRTCHNPADVYSSLTDFLKDREVETVKREVNQKVLSATDPHQLKADLAEIVGKKDLSTSKKIEKQQPLGKLYKYRKSLGPGMKTGMNPVDDLTSGIQGGLTATVAAWTSHGKSLSLYNSAYVNICEGKNLIYFALEIPKEMVYQIMLARHSYSYGKMIIPYERIVKGQLNDKEEEFVFGELEGDFLKLPGSMIALNMEDIDSFTRQGLISLYRSAEEELGGLDGVYWDHVNLFEYLNFDRNMSGDHYVKLVSDVGKDYRTDKNTLISTLLAAQVNRTGWQRATKKEGQYDMLALSEFHEIERSSTYVIFIFADSFMLQMNEMKVQIVKHRIGRVMESPEIIYVNAECSVVGEDFNTVGSPGGEGFTEALDDILGDNLGGFGDFSL